MPKSLKLYRNVDKATKYRNSQRKGNYAKGRIYANSRKKRYSDEELEMVLDHSIADIELAKRIGRSVQSIQIKRSRLKSLGYI